MNRVSGLSNATKLNVTGLVLTAGGMLLQMAMGSTLYPTFAGPIVLLAATVFVALGPGSWRPFVGIIVPLLLGIGAIIAALISGQFIEQLTDIGQAGILVGSAMHVVGLVAAIAGGIGMLQERPEPVSA